MTRKEIRRLNGEQYVRLTCLDGAVFEGEATHDPADYCFHEFGRDEEAVEIDHWVFYLGDIVSIELAEPREVGRWMSRPLHRMHLAPEAFAAMEAGQKTLELRLYDEKRRRIQAGDFIRFEDRADELNVLYMQVEGLRFFASFDELYAALSPKTWGNAPDKIKTASPRDMDPYYPPEAQKKWGVVAIELSEP